MELICRPNMSVEQALKEFKRMMKKSGILKDFEKSLAYQSPSKKKRLKRKYAEIRRKADERYERERQQDKTKESLNQRIHKEL